MPDREIIYVGDPMCSWCWGFAPVLDSLRDKYAERFKLRIIVGGLRPGPQAEPLDARLKDFLRREWRHIHEVTGQPFDYAFLDREGFLYNTDPASRAVVTMRVMKPGAEHELFQRLQRAFYAENTDITNIVNYPALVPFDSSAYFANNLVNLLGILVAKSDAGPKLNFNFEDDILAAACVTYQGANRQKK